MFDSLGFWGAFALAFAAGWLLPASAVRTRAALLALTSLLVLVGVLGLSPGILAVVLGSAVWIVAALRVAREREGVSSTRRGLAVFAPVLALWVAGKQSTALAYDPLSWLYFVGFSFFLVKAWTLIKDHLDGRFETLEPVSVFAYFLHFPTWVSGPMHYYTEFDASLRHPRSPDAAGWVDAVFRLVLGMLKVRFLAPLLTPLSLTEALAAQSVDLAGMAVACVAYSLVLYLDFSGYCDMAIACSRMLGIDVPENFANPYFATNLRDFWRRWHISFTRALTAYVFIPVTRALGTKTRLARRRALVAGLGNAIAFGFCGYWHGATANFVLWGLYHAAGLIAYDNYSQWRLRRRRGRKRSPRPVAVVWTTTALSMLVTFAFVSLGWTLFVFPLDRLF